jgi:hypothetical protein
LRNPFTRNYLTRLNRSIATITTYGLANPNRLVPAQWAVAQLNAWLANPALLLQHQQISALISQNGSNNRPGITTRHAKTRRKYRRAEILIEAVVMNELRNVAKSRVENIGYAQLDIEMGLLLADAMRQGTPFAPDVAKSDLSTHRPLKIGVSIGNHPDGGPGTISCFVSCNLTGDRMLMSNFHVAANSYPNVAVPLVPGPVALLPAALPGMATDIIQKAGLNGGVFPAHKVADYTRGILDGAPTGIDAAVCTLLPGMACANQTPGGAGINNVPLAPAVGMAVWKRGCSSGIQHGTITAIGHHGTTQYNPKFGGQLIMANCVQVTGNTGQFQIPGDSGSLLIDSATNRPVAQLHGGGGQMGLATPIADVLAALNVTII